jgi:hypothetical protein
VRDLILPCLECLIRTALLDGISSSGGSRFFFTTHHILVSPFSVYLFRTIPIYLTYTSDTNSFLILQDSFQNPQYLFRIPPSQQTHHVPSRRRDLCRLRVYLLCPLGRSLFVLWKALGDGENRICRFELRQTQVAHRSLDRAYNILTTRMRLTWAGFGVWNHSITRCLARVST